MKNFTQKMLSSKVKLVLLLTFASCSGAKQSTGPVTLQVFSLASLIGVQDTWWNKMYTDALGIHLEFLANGGEQMIQKQQTYIAGGKLPDIMYFNDMNIMKNAIDAGLTVPLDEHQDALPSIYKYAGAMVRFMTDTYGDGEKLYAVKGNIANRVPEVGDNNFGPVLRYDLYKKAGSPPVHTFGDYIDVLEKMQNLDPVNGDGKKVYAMSIWKDWDRWIMAFPKYLSSLQGVANGYWELAELDISNNKSMDNPLPFSSFKITPTISRDSVYVQSLKFLFELNQRGLLDPDSVNQRFQDAMDKFTDGRALFSIWNWGTGQFGTLERADQGIGFKHVQAKDASVNVAAPKIIGQRGIVLGKGQEHLEKSLKFLDYTFNPDAALALYNGPKGLVWDIGPQGKPVVLKGGYPYLQDSQNNPLPESFGGADMSTNGAGVGILGLFTTYYHPEYNVPLANNYWDKPEYAPEETLLDKTWEKDMQAKDQMGFLIKNNLIAIEPYSFTFLPPLPDDILQISNRIGDFAKTSSWKIVLAKDEMEFNRILDDMIARVNDMNYDKALDWFRGAFKEGFETSRKYIR